MITVQLAYLTLHGVSAVGLETTLRISTNWNYIEKKIYSNFSMIIIYDDFILLYENWNSWAWYFQQLAQFWASHN